MDLSDHKLIFVGGLHRSGTTPLARALGRHPEASGFFATGAEQDEGQWLQDVFPTEMEWGGPGLFGFDPAARLGLDSPYASPDSRARILEQWSTYWDLSKRWLVEKTPSNLIRARFLRALAPDSAIVIVMRHPVVAAMATHRWMQVSLPILIEHWLRCHAVMRDELAGQSGFVVVKYEAFVADPQAMFDAICEAIGLPHAPLTEEVRPGVNRDYQNIFRTGGRGAALHHEDPAGPFTRQMRTWTKQMRMFLRHRGFAVDSLPAEAPYIEQLCADRIRSWGYFFDDFDRYETALWTPETLPSSPCPHGEEDPASISSPIT